MYQQWRINSINYKKTSNIQINFNWIQFYFWTYKLLLSNFNSITNYESYVLTSKMLISLLSNNTQSIQKITRTTVVKPRLPNSRQLSWKYSTRPSYNLSLNETTSTFWKKTSKNFDLFLLYLQFSNTSQTSTFKIHAYYRPLFISEYDSISPYLNIKKFYAKWNHAYNFLLNLFFEDAKLLMFSHKVLKTETLAFNWSFNLLSFNLFKYSSPYFFLKEFDYGDASTITFKRLAQQQLQIACISDIKYHEKTYPFLHNSCY